MRTLKRIAVFILAAVLFASLSLSLVSCSTRLSGTYETSSSTSSASSSNVSKTTYVFDGKMVKRSKTITVAGSTISNFEAVGTYDISYKGWNDGYEITFVWDAYGEYANTSEADRTQTYSFEKTSTYIRINDVGYTKVHTEESHEGHDH